MLITYINIVTFFQISFVLTGYCNDRNEESYKVYHKIATACSGQVFNTMKDEVEKVRIQPRTVRGINIRLVVAGMMVVMIKRRSILFASHI
jgi:hypothetical protein